MRHSTELVISKLDLASPETFHERILSICPTASRSGMAIGNGGVVLLPIWIFLLALANFKRRNGILENNKQ